MKKLNLIVAIILSSSLAFTSCKDKDKEQPTPISQLPAEEQKATLENEGVKFVQNMDAVADLEIYNVIDELRALLDEEQSEPVMVAVSNKLNSIKKGPKSDNSLKSMTMNSIILAEGEDEFELPSEVFNEYAGIYTYDETAEDQWPRTPATDQITYKFELESGESAELSLYEFKYVTAKNMEFEEGITAELPTSIKMKITLGTVELSTFSFTGEYYEDDTPKFLEEVITLEGFEYKTTFDLRSKSALKYDNSFKYDETVIYANGLELNGNVDYDDIEAQIEEMENSDDEFPMDQEIITNTSAYIQFGNIKADAAIDVKNMLSSASGNMEDMDAPEAVELMNANIYVYIKYADTGETFAKSEFYVSEYEDTYSEFNWETGNYDDFTETVVEPAMKMVFNDGTAFDGDFVENGFGDVFDEMNTIIEEMNNNYELNMDKIDY